MEKLTLHVPLTVMLPRKKSAGRNVILNLNHYRNDHHMILNPAKIVHKDSVAWALTMAHGYIARARELMPEPPYLFTYTLYPKDARGYDLANVCSIVQKFTDDALIELGIIEDDNFRIVRAVNYRYGEVDKLRPRAELEITHYEQRES